MPGAGGDPGKVVGDQIKKLVDKDPMAKEVMKGVQGFIKDEKMQKLAKDMMKGPMQGLNDLNKAVNPTQILGNLGKLFQ